MGDVPWKIAVLQTFLVGVGREQVLVATSFVFLKTKYPQSSAFNTKKPFWALPGCNTTPENSLALVLLQLFPFLGGSGALG